MKNREDSFKEILEDVMRCYNNKVYDYLMEQPDGTITDADVVLMIMNLTIGVCTNIYLSIKEYLPTTTVDFDFIRAKVINALSDEFNKAKEYIPKTNLMPLTTDQVKEILKNGFCILKMPDGSEKKVDKRDLLFKKDDIDSFIKESKRESINANPPKIIVPGGKKITQ